MIISPFVLSEGKFPRRNRNNTQSVTLAIGYDSRELVTISVPKFISLGKL